MRKSWGRLRRRSPRTVPAAHGAGARGPRVPVRRDTEPHTARATRTYVRHAAAVSVAGSKSSSHGLRRARASADAAQRSLSHLAGTRRRRHVPAGTSAECAVKGYHLSRLPGGRGSLLQHSQQPEPHHEPRQHAARRCAVLAAPAPPLDLSRTPLACPQRCSGPPPWTCRLAVQRGSRARRLQQRARCERASVRSRAPRMESCASGRARAWRAALSPRAPPPHLGRRVCQVWARRWL